MARVRVGTWDLAGRMSSLHNIRLGLGLVTKSRRWAAVLSRSEVCCLADALPSSRVVWGGDFNQSLAGPGHAGSMAGKRPSDHGAYVAELSL